MNPIETLLRAFLFLYFSSLTNHSAFETYIHKYSVYTIMYLVFGKKH